jgi:hypothetical protein
VGPEPVLRLRERLRERVRPLLDEPPYRLAFDVEFARQLAAAGAPAEAASVLRRTARDVPSEEVDYQLAGFLALAGDLAESAAILRRCISEGEGVRVGFDAPSLLLRVAAERRDAADAATAVGFLANDDDRQRAQPGLGATLRARANLLMDRLEAADGEVRSWPWAADGDALAVLARWRLGRSLPADVGTMKAFLTVAGDGEKDGELALAAALLAAGRPDEAARRCRDLSKRLEWDARRSLERRQQLLLARGLHARALLATGDVDAARAKAHEVLSEARPGLLWTNLANEVLGAVGRDAAARR